MKLVAIGDIHGREIWKKIVEKEKNADYFIFIGDYFDSFGIAPSKQIQNFKEILKFKKENWDKVVLLTGNHDFHYLPEAEQTYSGYNHKDSLRIGSMLAIAVGEDYLQMCVVSGKYIFTHAGITKTWLWNWLQTDKINSDFINMLLITKPEAFRFQPGKRNSNFGDDITQSPIWVRPMSLIEDSAGGIMVVGHTHVNGVQITDKLIMIDAFDTSEEYLIIKDDIAKVAKL